jgi:hypothetical protein
LEEDAASAAGARTPNGWPPARRASVVQTAGVGLILAEIQAPQGLAAERILDEFHVAVRAQVKAEFFRRLVVELTLAGNFHLLEDRGNFLEMIRVEIILIDLFGVESRINFQFHNEAPITQLLSTKIARKVQHQSRILREYGDGKSSLQHHCSRL